MINLVNSGAFAFDFFEGGSAGNHTLTLGWTPTTGNTLVMAVSWQSAVGDLHDYMALGVASVVDSDSNSLTSLTETDIQFTSSGALYQNSSQIWYLTECSDATTFTFDLTGGAQGTPPPPVGSYGDQAAVTVNVFELTPVLLDTSAASAVHAGHTFSGPTLVGTGSSDFYVVAFGGQFDSSIVTMAGGWTVLTGPSGSIDTDHLDTTAYLISSGSQATSFTKGSPAAAFPYFPISGAAFSDNSAPPPSPPSVSPTSFCFHNMVWCPTLPSVGSGAPGFGTQNPQLMSITASGAWSATSASGMTLVEPSSGSGDATVLVGINRSFPFPRSLNYAAHNRIRTGTYTDQLVITSAGGSTTVDISYYVGWGDALDSTTTKNGNLLIVGGIVIQPPPD